VSEDLENLILSIRGRLVMLDADLAALYGVRTKHLNQQVKRNPERFPEDFMFQLTEEEAGRIEHVPGVNGQYRGRRHRPFAFTEHGAGMLVAVLRSPVATRVSTEILRTFARLRRQDELEPPRSGETKVRGLFAAIRDAMLCLPGDREYTTEVPYTYFFQAGENGPIKVGWTRNLPVRLRALRATSPEPLKLLGVMKGAEAEEHCHARLAAFRLHGEWFMPSPVVLDFIRENAAIPKSCGSLARD
jgi:hypothetical protein